MARRRKSENGDDVKCNKSRKGEPLQRNAANARERSRMRVLSKAFSRLKTTLPWVPPDTKLSKLDTLRLASCYIAHLKQILEEDDAASGLTTQNESTNTEDIDSTQGNVHPINLTWPFSFNGRAPDSKQGDNLKMAITISEITASSS